MATGLSVSHTTHSLLVINMIHFSTVDHERPREWIFERERRSNSCRWIYLKELWLEGERLNANTIVMSTDCWIFNKKCVWILPSRVYFWLGFQKVPCSDLESNDLSDQLEYFDVTDHIFKCSRRRNSRLSEYFILINFLLVMEIVHLTSKNKPVVCRWNSGSYKRCHLEKFLFVQSNQFLITSFTKWTHNRPHSWSEWVGTTQVTQLMIFKIMTVSKQGFYCWQSRFELISYLKFLKVWQGNVLQTVETKNWEQSDQLFLRKTSTTSNML